MTQKSTNKNDDLEQNLVLKTIAMPADTNFNGDIFGGWLISQMDLGGCIAARKISKSRVTTVAIDKMTFKHPVHVGDTVCCYAKHLKTGKTSMQFEISVYCAQEGFYDRRMVTQAIFTYVAINEHGEPITVSR
jgi:acyl-CoA thioesterase YciA